MYEFSLPTKVVFGQGAIEKIGEEITKLKKEIPLHYLIVTMGERWARELAGKIKNALMQAGGKKIEIFDQIEPNPTRGCIKKGVDFSRRCQSQAIVALGGGSSMDAAKVIAREAKLDLLVTLPTTAGTGGEISPWAVIINEKTREKESIIAKVPDLALLDPDLTLSMSPSLTLLTGIDAFSHALEAYMSKAANSLTDALAFKALELVKQHIFIAIEEGENIKAREKMLEASLLAGIAMLHAGLGLIHAIANTLGGLYPHLPHGWIIIPLLGKVSEFNRPANPDKFAKIERYIYKIEAGIHRMAEQGGLEDFPSVSIQREDLELLIKRSLNNINATTNPVDFTYQDVKEIIIQSFQLSTLSH